MLAGKLRAGMQLHLQCSPIMLRGLEESMLLTVYFKRLRPTNNCEAVCKKASVCHLSEASSAAMFNTVTNGFKTEVWVRQVRCALPRLCSRKIQNGASISERLYVVGPVCST